MLEYLLSLGILWLAGNKLSQNDQLLKDARNRPKRVQPKNALALYRDDYGYDLVRMNPSNTMQEYQAMGLVFGSHAVATGIPTEHHEWSNELGKALWSNTMERQMHINGPLLGV